MNVRPFAWLARQRAGTVPRPNFASMRYAAVKRAMDLLFVALAAPIAIVLIVGCGLLILVLMGRPVFFVQSRTGKDGCIFQMYKLRTMEQSRSGTIVATAKNDPRITS